MGPSVARAGGVNGSHEVLGSREGVRVSLSIVQFSLVCALSSVNLVLLPFEVRQRKVCPA